MVYLTIARMFSGIILKLAFLGLILAGVGILLLQTGAIELPTLSDFVQIPFSF